MALTVKETKAGSRPASGYPVADTKTVPAHPLRLKAAGTDLGGTILHQRPLKVGMRKQFQMSGKRGSTVRPVLGPLGTKSRTIL